MTMRSSSIFARWNHIVDLDKQNVSLHFYVIVFEKISLSLYNTQNTTMTMIGSRLCVFIESMSSDMDKQMVRLLYLIFLITFETGIRFWFMISHYSSLFVVKLYYPGLAGLQLCLLFLHLFLSMLALHDQRVRLGAPPVFCFNVRKSIIKISPSLTVKIYHDIDNRCYVLSSSNPCM